MPEQPRTLTLSNLADGAAEELFQQALARVLENVDDPNTDAKARRVITLSFTVTPDEDRRTGKVAVSCSTRLAGISPMRVNIHIGRHDGRVAAVEALHQEELFPQPQARPALVTGQGA